MSLPSMQSDHSDEQNPPSELLDDGELASHQDGLGQDFALNTQPPNRIPNLGHALLFIVFAAIMLILFGALALLLLKSPPATSANGITVQHPKLLLAAQAATYVTTVFAAWLFYPMLWQRGFLDGLGWNWTAASRQAPKLIAAGLLLGATAQIATYFVTPPKSLPIDDFFLTQSDAWLITIFGTIVAPIFEEICFRGFLFPAFAIAYDWLSLPRTPDAHARWQTTTTLTRAALIFSAILSSILFALLHAEQVERLPGILLVLFCVSLVLTFVRFKTQSVASSAMVHGTYNFLVFLLVMMQTGGYSHLDRLTR